MSHKMKNKSICLPVFDIELTVGTNDCCGTIRSSLKEGCPSCSKNDCFLDCDESVVSGNESEIEARERIQRNRAYEGIESLILACACEGIGVETPEFLASIESAVEAVEERNLFNAISKNK